jgi:hypothetical protein
MIEKVVGRGLKPDTIIAICYDVSAYSVVVTIIERNAVMTVCQSVFTYGTIRTPSHDATKISDICYIVSSYDGVHRGSDSDATNGASVYVVFDYGDTWT